MLAPVTEAGVAIEAPVQPVEVLRMKLSLIVHASEVLASWTLVGERNVDPDLPWRRCRGGRCPEERLTCARARRDGRPLVVGLTWFEVRPRLAGGRHAGGGGGSAHTRERPWPRNPRILERRHDFWREVLANKRG